MTKRKTIKRSGHKRSGHRSRLKRKTQRRNKKQRGGNCYGRGVGANNYEPNFSIYNTNELQLFPYKPT